MLTCADEHLFLCLRQPRFGTKGPTVLFLVNFSPEERGFPAEALSPRFCRPLRELLGNQEPTTGSAPRTGINLPAYSIRWLELG